MKNLLLIIDIFFSGMLLKAQETFSPTKEGTVLIYKSFDKKYKETGIVKYTIKHVNVAGSNMAICSSIPNWL